MNYNKLLFENNDRTINIKFGISKGKIIIKNNNSTLSNRKLADIAGIGIYRDNFESISLVFYNKASKKLFKLIDENDNEIILDDYINVVKMICECERHTNELIYCTNDTIQGFYVSLIDTKSSIKLNLTAF